VRKPRPARELVVAYLFGPLADRAARALARLGIPPPAVVLANAAAGLLAALALWRGSLAAAAVLLQVKTLLDNADGQLARLSGRVTLLGRYLDTEADLAVNLVLFAVLGAVTGEPWLALAAFWVLTLVLSVNFNVAELYREISGEAVQAPTAAGSGVERALEGVYRWVFAPQDRLIRGISHRRLERILRGAEDAERRRRATLAYHDGLTIAVLGNLGLSTQLVVLGACLVAGVPELYLWLVLGSAALLPLLQLRREHLARRAR
jgi:archaetidylinositol phosphate synthase